MITAVAIGRPGQLSLGDQAQFWEGMPLYYHTRDWHDIDREAAGLREKLEYRAQRRNVAVILALEQYPDTEHLMMIDSFYLSQPGIGRLVKRYRQLADACLGPVVWGRMRVNLSQVLHSPIRFYDGWATPELRWCPYGWRPDKDMLTSQAELPLKGLYRVSSIAGCYLFPRSIWDKGARYEVPEDLHGCEQNGFHESHRLKKYVDFSVEFWRTKRYGLVHCARISLGNWLRTR